LRVAIAPVATITTVANVTTPRAGTALVVTVITLVVIVVALVIIVSGLIIGASGLIIGAGSLLCVGSRVIGCRERLIEILDDNRRVSLRVGVRQGRRCYQSEAAHEHGHGEDRSLHK
jgi:hypothetical protein